MSSERIYEEERLLLELQEALALAIEKSGMTHTEIAARLGKHRAFITQALSGGRNLTVKSIAGLLWATGFRIHPQLTPVLPERRNEDPYP